MVLKPTNQWKATAPPNMISRPDNNLIGAIAATRSAIGHLSSASNSSVSKYTRLHGYIHTPELLYRFSLAFANFKYYDCEDSERRNGNILSLN